MVPAPLLDLTQADLWISMLHGGQPGFINIVSKGDWEGLCFDLNDPNNRALAYVQHLDEQGREGIYLRCTTMSSTPDRHRRGGSDSALSLPGLWADVDRRGPGHAADNLPSAFEDALALVEEASLPIPSAWIESGGGWYPWWLLQNPHLISDDRPDVEALSRDWHRALGEAAKRLGFRYETGTHDLARVLRVPGTVNRKEGLSRQCKILSQDGPAFELDELKAWRDKAVAKVETTRIPVQRPEPVNRLPVVHGTGKSPFDDFEERVDWGDDLLLGGAGWQMSHGRVNGPRSWTRPGKDLRDGISATTGRANDRDRLFVFTTSTEFEPQIPYTKGGAYAVLHHGGDMAAAARALRAAGFGEPASAERSSLEQWADPGVVGQPPTVDPSPEPKSLTEEFWNARACLRHIRQAAWSKQRSAEAVLGACLARVAALVDYRIRIPGIVGNDSTLTVFSVIAAPSGVGKTTATGLARKLLPAPEGFADGLPLGTGEGMAEIFYGTVEEEYEDGNGNVKTRKVRAVTRHNAFFDLDEGEVLGQISKRMGSTLLQTMRSAFSGSTLGAMNASEERRRVVPGDQYQMGLTIGVQDQLASTLLDDAAGGTPQRCAWFSAIDPLIPPPGPEQPPWPGPLPWMAQKRPRVQDGTVTWLGGDESGDHRPFYMRVDGDVQMEIKIFDWSKGTGAVQTDELDSHIYLVRLKIAALLALLDDRFDVNKEDWALAAAIMANSNRHRTRIMGVLREEQSRKAQASAEAQAVRELYVSERREQEIVRKIESRIIRVLAEGPSTRRDLQRRMSKAQADFFESTLDMMIDSGKIAIDVIPSDTLGGTDKKLVRLA